MWVVRLALSRPYTFIVMAILIVFLGCIAIFRTATDIFPEIKIPVISVIWNYTGLPPDQMSGRITNYFERVLTTTVNDIEHIESEALLGVSVTKIYFHEGTNVDVALSQITSISQTLLRSFPPGTTPPLILVYNASTVPVLQLMLSSQSLTEQKLFDLANNTIRTGLATVQGAALPYPYGGKFRQIQVDLNPEAMQAYGLSAQDVNAAIDAQNLILPAGTEKIGSHEYIVKLNASPLDVKDMNNFPIKTTEGSTLFIKDVAYVRDGFSPQTNIVRVDGTRAVMMSVQKTGKASTLSIIQRVKDLIPQIKETLPETLKLDVTGDESLFIKAAIKGVIQEGILAAILTGLMILLFLGSWHSTAIITISIPLSILCSIILLSALGQTINIMTLSGLALAVGILVDDATVAIENINWNLEQGKDVEKAILDGADQIALPALVATLCICIVFVPMFFLQGVPYYLFVPFAEAVIFAMLASYLLSRTLVPTLAKYWLHKHDDTPSPQKISRFAKISHHFENHFENFRKKYKELLTATLAKKEIFSFLFFGFLLFSTLLIFPWLGSDFFPTIDEGQMKLHIRAPTGTRVEDTAKICDEIDKKIREIIPAKELLSIIDNIGLPNSGINLSYSNSAPVGPADADILIYLNKEHRPTHEYMRILREVLPSEFPAVSFAFLSADIVSQILNFGLPSPINIKIIGPNKKANRKYANEMLAKIKRIPGIVDARIKQAYNYPELHVNVDRTLANELGLTQLDVGTNMLITLSGSFQTTPTFWLDPNNNVSYPVVTQAPQYRMDSLQALNNIPITHAGTHSTQFQILGALATIERSTGSVVESLYNAQPILDIFASVQDRDLGGITQALNKIIQEMSNDLPRGSHVSIEGQIKTQKNAFNGLYFGLIFSIILVYLLIVVNFQSWVDPLIIISALPAAITGIAWMLFLTNTTLSVPALTGAIMCMGVATANSILVISFARDQMKKGDDVITAAIQAGFTRIRPVLMTALAMIIGMLPMSLGLGEGGEQNAPLGRAVIGGLLFATVATLFFVPSLFCLIHSHLQNKASESSHD